ncbi:hypothetical protein D1007_60656 [Hordeum vulgare]|nr:hypothetical protein D1007_60656 [Hordeum vulgare]
MVYEDESSNDLSSLDISSSSDNMLYRIPASIDDEDYMGIENSALDVCSEHRLSPKRRVAFEGFETGRRPEMIINLKKLVMFVDCHTLSYLDKDADPEWPPTMQNALLKLWEMLEDSKSARRDDNLESSLKIHQLTEEKINLDANYDKLVEYVNQLLNAQKERVMDLSYLQAQGRVIRNQKANHLKEKEKLSEENYNLKVQVDKLNNSEKNLNDDIVVLNLHIDGLKKGI